MGLVPIKGGVLEYGITLRALLKLSMEACGADYALCWSSTLGTHLATTSSCVHPRFRETLRERQLEAEFDTLWVNASLNARSSAGALCHRNLAPVSTCMQTGLVADVGASFMKRGPLAARFGIASAAFLPAAGDVIEIGKVRSSHDGTGWEAADAGARNTYGCDLARLRQLAGEPCHPVGAHASRRRARGRRLLREARNVQ